MAIKFNDFKIRGIDVSGYNDVVNWQRAKDYGVHFSGIRVGFGNTTDKRFLQNWVDSKEKVVSFPYWYLDYYSNWYNQDSIVYGLSDEAWGKLQAQNCWNLIKNTNKHLITFLDIESGHPSYSPPMSTCKDRVMRMAKAFLVELDRLSGLFNGIYCSISWLTWFDTWFRDRPLWVAWYTRTPTPASVLSKVKSNGWTGMCYIWQYASDGDADNDGTGDGIEIGSSYNTLDLNGWIESDQSYLNFSNGTIPEPEAPEDSLFKVKVIITNLNIRQCPNTSCTKIGTAVYGKIYDIYEVSGDWMRIGKAEWFYGIPSYVQKIGDTTTGKRPTSLVYPLPEGIRISQYFGSNPSWYTQSKGHNGIDWACSTGTPIYAMQDGVVSVSSEFSQPHITDGKIGYGRHVRIKHPEGTSIYGHLTRRDVQEGQSVKAGQQIGLSGGATSDPNSGFSTGAHLHAEYRVDNLPNPVPGGYTYNAFDFLPILVSKPLPEGISKWKVTSSIGLKIRSAPNLYSEKIGVMVYNEEFLVSSVDANNWGKLHNREGYSLLDYAKKIEGETPPVVPPPASGDTKWKVTATLGLRIRSKPNLFGARLGALAYNEEFYVSSIDSNNWGKLRDKEGYVLLDYAKQI